MSSRQEKAIAIAQYTKPQLDGADIVIVGNGIAGLTAALEARRLASDKRIVIVTDQVHPTINTPALKQFAIGKLSREQLLAYPAGTERTERIHIVTSRVEEIHAKSKYVTLSGGRGFGYEALLIATGSTPNGLPEHTPGRDFDGVRTLHRLQDYLDLRRRLGEVSETVVIGGGVHAIETVMGLLFWGVRVHWLIRSETFMPHALDEVASEMVLERVRHSGGNVYTGTEVAGIVGRIGSVAGVITNQQKMIPCQLVLVCTGTRAATTLAERCSLPMQHKRGIYVDDQLRTSVSDIYAAGDVAALKNPLTGHYEPRAQWYAAVSQGRTVAAMMTGHESLARQPFGVQWHATHLGELSMLTVGSPLLADEHVEVFTDTSQGGYRRVVIVNDRLVGYLSLGSAQPDSLSIKRIIDEGHSVRDITKSLLKGKFDARHYLSQRHKRAAQGMLNTVTSGKLPLLPAAYDPVSQVQLLPLGANTGPLSPPPPARQTDSLSTVGKRLYGDTGEHERSEGVASTDELRRVPQEGRTVYGSNEREVGKRARELPMIPEDEVSPFTGTLPSLPPRVVESTLTTAPSQQRPGRKHNLWSYGKTPTTTQKKPTRRSTGSLWSYTNKDAALERDR